MLAKIESGQETIAVDQDADHDELITVVAQLVEENRELREDNDALRQEVEDLRDDHADHQEHTAKERAEDRQRLTDAEDRLDDLEDGLASSEPVGSDGEDTPADTQERPQTPLEQTVGLPQEMIEQESANVRRAVFVASDAEDYTTKVPAGRVIKSSDLRRVLTAGTDARGHTQTVDRVMSVLEEMGGDDVRIVDRRGERRVLFSEEIVARLERIAQPERAESHAVVTRGEV